MTMAGNATHEELERKKQGPKNEFAKRKLVEEALCGSETLYRILFDNVGDAVLLLEGGRILDCNRNTLEMFRRSREEILGHSLYVYSPPDQPDGEGSRNKALHHIHEASKGRPQSFHWTYLRADGSTFQVELSLNAVELATGIYVQAIMRETTRRKETERSLRESEEKNRLVVENANDAIYIAQDERIRFPNPKTVEIFGYSEEEFARTPLHELIHPDDRDMVMDRHHQRLNGNTPPNAYEFRIVSKAGDTVPVSLSTVRITWEGRPATLNFLRDITQQKEWDKITHKIERMEAIGTLAGGLAHNFNNALMGIQGRASLLLMHKEPSHPDVEHLKGMEASIRRAAELTKDLLAFAKGGKYEVKPTSMNTLIQHENQIFSQTKKEIRFTEHFEESLWNVDADQGQMRQMLMNLYLNAWQAMPEGGELYVRTENVIVDEDHGGAPEGASGRYVKMTITDTGTGMDQATLDKIFDPFFTTRDMGVGTGLGLASVYGIVRNHGGFIQVSSEEGKGTSFAIFLPASEKEVAEDRRPSKGIVKGEGTILLVDDEKMILDVGELLLGQLGYTVMTSDNGKDAVGLYIRNREKIDLVLLDMIMPGMSGGATFDLLKEIDPDIKVVLASGYSMDSRAREILDRGCRGFIQKPFSIIELSHKIQEHMSCRASDGEARPLSHPQSMKA